MTRHIIPQPSELPGIMNGSVTKWAVPVKPQPVHEAVIINCPECNEPHADTGEWFEKAHKTHLCLKCGHLFRPKETPTTGIIPPHPLNQPIAVKETWHIRSWDCQGYISIRYKDGGVKHLNMGLWPDDEDKETNLYIGLSDYLDSINCEKDEDGNYTNFTLPWRSPATQPIPAVRTWITFTGVKCVRVQDLTIEEVVSMYCAPNAIAAFQRLHQCMPDCWEHNLYVFLFDLVKTTTP